MNRICIADGSILSCLLTSRTCSLLGIQRQRDMPEDGEIVDAKKALEADCKPAYAHLWNEYQACSKRIAAKGYGDCAMQYQDYFQSVDKCISKSLFSKLT